jgi:hypothetical protein
MNSELLRISLSAAVPLIIAELKARGGPTAEDLTTARAAAGTLGEHGDELMYRGKHSAQTFNSLAFAVAVLAFCPGGCKVFGDRYEANPRETLPMKERQPVPEHVQAFMAERLAEGLILQLPATVTVQDEAGRSRQGTVGTRQELREFLGLCFATSAGEWGDE